MKKLLFALLLLYPLSALAQTYEWTDKQGAVHFTDDLGKVPGKYRKKVKVLGGDDSGVTQTTITAESGKGEGKGEEKADKAKKLYGGKDENAWRSEFKVAKGEVKGIEAELATLRGRLSNTSSMSRNEYLTLQNTVKHNEIRLQEAQRRLETLQQNANLAGVPGEFR